MKKLVQPYIFQSFNPKKVSGLHEKLNIMVLIDWAKCYVPLKHSKRHLFSETWN